MPICFSLITCFSTIWHTLRWTGASLTQVASLWLEEGGRHYFGDDKMDFSILISRGFCTESPEVKLTFSNVPKSGLCHVSILMKKSSFIYSFCRKHKAKWQWSFTGSLGFMSIEAFPSVSIHTLTLQAWSSSNKESLATYFYRLVRQPKCYMLLNNWNNPTCHAAYRANI